MKRTQLQLSEPVFDALRRRAQDRGVSIAFVVREAVTRYLRADEPLRSRSRRSSELPPGFSWVGIGRAKRRKPGRPVSVYHDEALAVDVARQHGLRESPPGRR